MTLTGLPGGPVTVYVAGANIGSSSPTVTTATYTTNTLPAGTYNVTATFAGNASTLSSTASITQVVQPAPTTTTVTVNPNPAYQHQTVTFSVHVTGALAAPSGTVQILDGTTPLSTVALNSGNATFATALLAVGTHTITAVYSGDSNNLSSTSTPVTATILPSDFTLSLDPPSLSLVTGHHTTLKLTAQSIGNLTDTLHFTIAQPLPQWVTLTFTPADLQLASDGTATTSIYLDTDAVIGYMSQARSPGSNAGTVATTLALITMPFVIRRRRSLAVLSLAVAAGLLGGATGCAGKYPDSTRPGTYNLQIIATGAQSGLTHTITLPLTVTQ